MLNNNKQQNGNKSRLPPQRGSRKRKQRLNNRNTIVNSNSKYGITPTFLPISMAPRTKIGSPKIQSKDGRMIFTVTHKEFITTVSTSVAWAVSLRYRLNPGSSAAFPWLSGVAVNFETYKFRKLVFHYVTRASSTTIGSLLFAPDYDAEDAQYTSETQMANNTNSRECPLWSNLSIPLSPQRMNASYKQHFVMSDGRFNTTSQDTKTIDVGSFQIGGEAAIAGPHGKLWVEYQVDLMTPQVATEASSLQGGGSIDFNSFNVAAPTAFITAAPTIQNLENVLDSNQNGVGVNNTYPTNVIGTFIKDYQGIISNVFSGSGFTNLPILLLNGVSDATKLNTLGSGGITNAALTQSIRPWKISAKRGDILSYGNTLGATTLTGIHHDVGGAEFSALL